MVKKTIYKWKDKTGVVHKIPEGSCVICKNCTDIFLDPFRGNEIYSCVCGLELEDEFAHNMGYLDEFCSGYEQEEDVEEWKE